MPRSAVALIVSAMATAAVSAEDGGPPPGTEFTVRPIGHIKKADDRTWIVLDKQLSKVLAVSTGKASAAYSTTRALIQSA